jgi:hypothetical protein
MQDKSWFNEPLNGVLFWQQLTEIQARLIGSSWFWKCSATLDFNNAPSGTATLLGMLLPAVKL